MQGGRAQWPRCRVNKASPRPPHTDGYRIQGDDDEEALPCTLHKRIEMNNLGPRRAQNLVVDALVVKKLELTDDDDVRKKRALQSTTLMMTLDIHRKAKRRRRQLQSARGLHTGSDTQLCLCATRTAGAVFP